MTSAPHRRRRHGASILAGIFVSILVAWCVGLIRFAGAIPRQVEDPSTPTDAIVVLTGGSERLETGLKLLTENRAERVFVSGVHPNVGIDRLLQLAGQPLNALADRIDAGHDAKDTAGNATEAAAWMRSRGYRSLRLVTSSYHMPRSLLEFGRALPDIDIIPHPVQSNQVRQRDWWQWPGTAALVVSEYNKYLLSWLAPPAGTQISQISRAANG